MIKSTSRFLKRVWRRARGLNERCVSLQPVNHAASRGRVLLSYVIDAALVRRPDALPYSHPHFWETWAMIQGFLDEGYAVDVIHWTRRQPLPRLDYDIYVDVRRNFDRYAAALPASCLKIAHMDTAHHTVHNGNQRRRLAELQARRGIALDPFKLIEENQAAEHADLITVLGNTFTIESFAFAQKPITRIRLSNAFTYPFPESKDFHSARSRFLWMGSEGFVHKGLDLVLEAFDGMPNRELIVCGPIDREPAFRKAFADLLYRRPNIKTPGWVDVAGPAFKHIAESCIGLVYPSCSEGGGGCVITAMHAGLIPIVTREASVDVEPSCGMLLPDASVAGIRQAVSDVAEKPEAECAGMARAAWSWARENHTRERFRHEYRAFVRSLADRLEAKRAT